MPCSGVFAWANEQLFHVKRSHRQMKHFPAFDQINELRYARGHGEWRKS